MKARIGASSSSLSAVDRVSADIGLIVAFPHNLYQIARRTSSLASQRIPRFRRTRKAFDPLARPAPRFAEDQLFRMLYDDVLGADG